MDLELAGRRVLVTGAATGIGRSTVQTLAAEGCRIAALDIDEGGLAQLVAAVGTSVSAVPANLSTASGCTDGVAKAIEGLGGLDILINNVGTGAVRAFDELTDDDWQRTLDLIS